MHYSVSFNQQVYLGWNNKLILINSFIGLSYCNCLEFFKIYFIVACAQARTNDLTLKWSSSRGTNWNQQYQGGINTGTRRATANISSLNITYSNNDMSPFKARIIYYEIKLCNQYKIQMKTTV